MKLKDILARELKVWPESWGIFCVATKVDGNDAAWFNYRNPVFKDGGWQDLGSVELWLSQEPEDRKEVVVRRFEWQAAVDALRVEEFVSVLREGIELSSPIGESILLLQQVGRAYRKQPEWSEDGLPNVGTKCVVYKGSYALLGGQENFIGPVVTVTARFKSDRGIEMACVDSGTDLGCQLFRADMCFHLPTAEEIAFREREDAIAEMMAVAGMGSCKACTALYDRNYRKQVAK